MRPRRPRRPRRPARRRGTATGTATTSPTGGATASNQSSATSSTAGRAIPQALVRADATTTTRDRPAPPPARPRRPPPRPATATTPTAKPTDASDPNWVTPALQAQFDAETCADLNKFQGNAGRPERSPRHLRQRRHEKYILGPVEVSGTDDQERPGRPAGRRQRACRRRRGRCSSTSPARAPTSSARSPSGSTATAPRTTRNRFAIVVDGAGHLGPETNQPINGGQASITGQTINADERARAGQPAEVRRAAAVLQDPDRELDQPDPGQGPAAEEPAGRARSACCWSCSTRSSSTGCSGLVTVASLSIASAFTYGLVVYLGTAQGFRLTLAGVTGLIVSIGITADSFIVFFERVRDEVRDGRTLRSAVETGWNRARRTILAADSVSFLAAVVLFILATGSVAGLRLHPRPHDADRRAGRLPVHPSDAGAAGPDEVLRRGPPVERARPQPARGHGAQAAAGRAPPRPSARLVPAPPSPHRATGARPVAGRRGPARRHDCGPTSRGAKSS